MEARPCLFALQRVHKHGVRRLIGKNLTNKFSRKVSLNNVLGLFVSAILDFADSLEFVAWAFFGGWSYSYRCLSPTHQLTRADDIWKGRSDLVYDLTVKDMCSYFKNLLIKYYLVFKRLKKKLHTKFTAYIYITLNQTS